MAAMGQKRRYRRAKATQGPWCCTPFDPGAIGANTPAAGARG